MLQGSVCESPKFPRLSLLIQGRATGQFLGPVKHILVKASLTLILLPLP